MRALLDTNVLIDYLHGVAAARDELARYERAAISVITWMEVMSGANTKTERLTRDFLGGFELLGLDRPVAERAVQLRQQRRIKLPDAIIWATAQMHSLLLVTRNTRDFPDQEPGIRMPYRV